MAKKKTHKPIKVNPGIALWNMFCSGDSDFNIAAHAARIDTWLDSNKKEETKKAANWLRELADLMEKDVKN